VKPSAASNKSANQVDKSQSKKSPTKSAKPSSVASYKKIIQDIRKKLEIVNSEKPIKSTEMNWYMNASHAVTHMEIIYGVSRTDFHKYVVLHYLDSVNYDTKRVLFESTFERTSADFTTDLEIETHVANYFRAGLLKSRSKQPAIYIADKETAVLLIKDDETGAWTKGDKFDAEDFREEINTKYLVDKARLHDIVGYMLQFKDQEMSFYYKDIHLARNKKGRKCDRSGGKAPIIKMLNSVAKTARYNDANTSSAFMYSGTLCVILEMVLRSFHESNRDKRIYYLTPEQAIQSKMTEYSRTVA
jgi:hypothetical protein